jgi:hypothetical protein
MNSITGELTKIEKKAAFNVAEYVNIKLVILIKSIPKLSRNTLSYYINIIYRKNKQPKKNV